MGNVYLPEDATWKEPLLSELLTFPVGRNDDLVDALGLISRMLDTMVKGHAPTPGTGKVKDKYRSQLRKRSAEAENWKTA